MQIEDDLTPARFEYLISEDYVSSWGITQARRELLQNAMDCGGMEICGTSLMNDGVIPQEAWLLGVSIKDGDDAIGQFGEGLKLALLVLLRSGCEVIVRSGDYEYRPALVRSPLFNNKRILEVTRYYEPFGDRTEVEVTPCIQWEEGVLENPQKYRLLRDEPVLYVGGLYVCDLQDFRHGYNLSPVNIKLGRDRDVPDLSSLTVETARLISETLSPSEQYALLEDSDVRDAEDLHCFFTEELRAYVAALGAREPEALSGYRYAYRALHSELKPRRSYTGQRLDAFYAANKKHMRRAARLAFEELAKSF